MWTDNEMALPADDGRECVPSRSKEGGTGWNWTVQPIYSWSGVLISSEPKLKDGAMWHILCNLVERKRFVAATKWEQRFVVSSCLHQILQTSAAPRIAARCKERNGETIQTTDAIDSECSLQINELQDVRKN